MKNIHILPTDQPSRLYENTGALVLDKLSEVSNDGISINQHIYITSSEEIKEGDWIFNNMVIEGSCLSKALTATASKLSKLKEWEKIILTTDQDLIKDGVQEIDDEFLEWFVKNPTCEFVEIGKHLKFVDVRAMEIYRNFYEIIIPQEEPKLGYVKSETEFSGIEYTLKDGFKQVIIIGEGLPKQETLEETKYNCEGCQGKGYLDETDGYDYGKVVCPICVNDEEPKKAERMYSEEDMIRFMQYITSNPDLSNSSAVS